jgi:hypothetical protein
MYTLPRVYGHHCRLRQRRERSGGKDCHFNDMEENGFEEQEEERKKEGMRRPSCRSGTGSTYSIIAGVNEPGDFTCILVSIFGGQRRPTWLTNQQETKQSAHHCLTLEHIEQCLSKGADILAILAAFRTSDPPPAPRGSRTRTPPRTASLICWLVLGRSRLVFRRITSS